MPKIEMSDKTYDTLKWVCIIFLPALSTAYSAMAGIWGLPVAKEVPATINTISLFLGACLGVSSAEYNKKIDGGT